MLCRIYWIEQHGHPPNSLYPLGNVYSTLGRCSQAGWALDYSNGNALFSSSAQGEPGSGRRHGRFLRMWSRN
jgi:hypothetical protein